MILSLYAHLSIFLSTFFYFSILPTCASQDDELLKDGCAALITICDVSAENIQMVMEQGIFSR